MLSHRTLILKISLLQSFFPPLEKVKEKNSSACFFIIININIVLCFKYLTLVSNALYTQTLLYLLLHTADLGIEGYYQNRIFSHVPTYIHMYVHTLHVHKYFEKFVCMHLTFL